METHREIVCLRNCRNKKEKKEWAERTNERNKKMNEYHVSAY